MFKFAQGYLLLTWGYIKMFVTKGRLMWSNLGIEINGISQSIGSIV